MGSEMWDGKSYLSEVLSQRQLKKLEKREKKILAGEKKLSEDRLEKFQRDFKLEPRTQGQAEILYGLRNYNQVVISGPAGVGKTFVVSAYAAQQFLKRKINKIIITRPNEPTGRSLGLFPGSVDEKMAVWLQPVISTLKEVMGENVYKIAKDRGQIAYQPLETIRGMSFDDAFVIIDEAQNINIEEVKALVTRVGENTTLVFTGDLNQSDIAGTSGLQWVLDKIHMNPKLKEESYVVELDLDDVVRSKLCKLWVEAIG